MIGKTLLTVGGLLVLTSTSADLLACGDKFLVISRGTRFQRAVARSPARILVYANPQSTLPKALEKARVDSTLRKVGYEPTSVSAPAELEQALRDGNWDLVLVDLADGDAIRGRLQPGGRSPMIVPVVHAATGREIARAKKDYQHVIKGPIKSQAFLEAIDDALALRLKLQRASASE
jgi:hypothetical protein